MKKFFAAVILLAVLLSLSVGAEDSVYGSVVVDGVISAGEWDNASWQELSVVKDAPTVTGRVKLMNDENYLYMLVESVDETVCNTVSPNWNAEMSIDCLEFWFAADLDASAGAESYGDGSVSACLDHLGNFSWNGGDESTKDAILHAASYDGAKTTVYEIAIPLMNGVPGLTFGLNVAVNDTSDENGSRCGYVVLNEVGQWWVSPANLGGYLLAEPAAVEPEPETEAETVAAPAEDAAQTISAPQTADVFCLLTAAAACAVGACSFTRKKNRK